MLNCRKRGPGIPGKHRVLCASKKIASIILEKRIACQEMSNISHLVILLLLI